MSYTNGAHCNYGNADRNPALEKYEAPVGSFAFSSNDHPVTHPAPEETGYRNGAGAAVNQHQDPNDRR